MGDARHTDAFARAFGDTRGSDRPDDSPQTAMAVQLARLQARADTLAGLKARVPWSHVDVEAGATRYVALARSELSDDLHIVGGGASVEQAIFRLQDAKRDDFSPEAVVDLDAPADMCVHLTYRDGTDIAVEEEPDFGIADLI